MMQLLPKRLFLVLLLLATTTRCRWAVGVVAATASSTEECTSNGATTTNKKRALLRVDKDLTAKNLKDSHESSGWMERARSRLLGLLRLDDAQEEAEEDFDPQTDGHNNNNNNNELQFPPLDEEQSASKAGSITSSGIRSHQEQHAKSRALQTNSIVSENDIPGTPKTVWDLGGGMTIGDSTIQGFATDISVNKGNRIAFKVDSSTATNYVMPIYRLGYYGKDGARFIADANITAVLPQIQPACTFLEATKTTDCGNWGESAHWDVPPNAVSGIYVAKLTRTDTQGSSHIVFVVRDDASTSKILFKTSDTTWQAYNNYGGNSLYVGKASKVSYNRPFNTRAGGGGGGPGEDWVFNAEYPMVRWLERNGYDVTYTTDIDADRNGALIRNHAIFLSVGHDEYWSAGERANVEAARDAGVHLAFFSGNEVYWKTRWEPSFDGTNTAYRTLVCYKEGQS
jgi:hypothetical protein